jgi:thiol-disulfide isomerase/thioredoxin
MRLGKRSILWALGAGTVGLTIALGLAVAWLGQFDAPRIAAGPASPLLKGEMGEFSHFAVPRPVPPIAFLDGAGRTLGLGDFAGRVVLVNFWATWCAPCVREMPSLDRLQAALGGPDFTVVALSLDRQGKEAVAPYFAEHLLGHLAVYLDPEGEAFRAWRGQGVPTSFLIGRDGRAIGVLLGPAHWDAPEAIKLIRYYMGEGGRGAAGPQQTSTGLRAPSAKG